MDYDSGQQRPREERDKLHDRSGETSEVRKTESYGNYRMKVGACRWALTL